MRTTTPTSDTQCDIELDAAGDFPGKPVRRLAILLTPDRQPQWVAKLLTMLLEAGGVEISHVQIPGPSKPEPGFAHAILWRVCRRLDALLFENQTHPLRRIDIRPLLWRIPTIQLPLSHQPAFDVALDLSGRNPARLPANLATEVWTFRPRQSVPVELLSLRSRFHGAASIRLELVSRDSSGAYARLYEVRSAVDRWSDVRTLANCYRKAPAIISGRLARSGPEAVRGSRRDDGRLDSGLRFPSNSEAVRRLTILVRRYAGERLTRALCHQRWELAVASLEGLRSPASCFRQLTPPDACFWADPFPVVDRGRCFLFFEEFTTAGQKGRIMTAECGRGGFLSEPECVLERPYHLSYPFVFESHGALYMIPETRANRTIEVYACTSFPNKWELCRTLFPGIDASDPTPARIEDRWWLFTNVGRFSSAYDDLYLFHAADPLGKWTPHRGNPVKSDVRSGRSAGRIVIADGKAFRISQDCSRRYGYALNAHEITRLDPAGYHEKCAGRIAPARCSRRLLGIHTANAAGGLIFADALVQRSRMPFSTGENPFEDLRIRGFQFWQ
jgi:hypothetical protein